MHDKYNEYLASISIELTDQVAVHERQAYGLLDLLGDIGGVLEVILSMFGIIVLPYNQLAYKLKQI